MALLNQQNIIDYYDESKVAYRDVWHLDECMALHYGFWEKDVRNLKQALIRENEVLAKIIGISAEDQVLDAGCGVGGSSVFLAGAFRCSVHGISLSQNQVKDANQLAQKRNVADQTHFSVMDFHRTSFEDESFDVVWFLESFCHSHNPESLLKEMFRVLRPGGRIIIADGFMSEHITTEKDKKVVEQWLNNWAVNTIYSMSSIVKMMQELGLESVQARDFSQQVARSSLLLYRYARIALTYGRIKKWLGQSYGNEITVKNTLGAKYQYPAFKRKLWQYGVITAVKP